MAQVRKRWVVVVAALAIVVGGCGSATPAGPSAADKAASARAANVAAARAKQSAIYKECETFMGPLDTKLSNLDSLLDTGVQFSAYSSKLGEASIALNRLVKDAKAQGGLDDSCINKVGVPLQNAFNAYAHAGDTWNNCISDYNCSFDKGSAALTSAQADWTKAHRAISKSEAAMARLAPK